MHAATFFLLTAMARSAALASTRACHAPAVLKRSQAPGKQKFEYRHDYAPVRLPAYRGYWNFCRNRGLGSACRWTHGDYQSGCNCTALFADLVWRSPLADQIKKQTAVKAMPNAKNKARDSRVFCCQKIAASLHTVTQSMHKRNRRCPTLPIESTCCFS